MDIDKLEGLIGIWWYLEPENKVFGIALPLSQGVLQFNEITLERENHENMWEHVIYTNFSQIQGLYLYSLGYKGLERGSVYFNVAENVYYIHCVYPITQNNPKAQQEIIDFYHLNNSQYKFI